MDLTLCTAKKVAKGVGCSMGSLVVLQCHLWLMLTEIRDMDRSQLLDTPVNPQGLSDSVGAFSESQSSRNNQK